MKPESNIIDTINQNLFEVIYQMTGYIPLQSELKEIIDAVEKDKEATIRRVKKRVTTTCITHYVINNGKRGFTNKEISDHFEGKEDFDRTWRNFKASARKGLNNGQECMFYEDGKYHF